MSNRSINNYVKINCAAIPANLLESELFGYAEGAFSGATKGGKIGKFDLADNGTLLLDEISEMPLELQAKLLRVIQEKEVERVGGIHPVKVNVRLICCTNNNLYQLVQDGKFREDLYYRINVIELTIPPLRNRIEDIEELCQFFVARINREYGYQITGINDKVFPLLKRYHWPGNIRELEHVIERAAVLCKNGDLNLNHFSFLVEKLKDNPTSQTQPKPRQSLKGKTAKLEQESILDALEMSGWNKTAAAKLLNIDRSRLYAKMKKYGIDK